MDWRALKAMRAEAFPCSASSIRRDGELKPARLPRPRKRRSKRTIAARRISRSDMVGAQAVRYNRSSVSLEDAHDEAGTLPRTCAPNRTRRVSADLAAVKSSIAVC